MVTSRYGRLIKPNGNTVKRTAFSTPNLRVALKQSKIPGSQLRSLKQLSIEKAKISLQREGKTIVLSTDVPALFVHLEHDGGGRFSDSSFTLLPGIPKTVSYLGDDLESLSDTLRVYDLSHTY